MPKVYCVRAEYGKYTQNFASGGYVAIGWMPNVDLSNVKNREELYPIYKREYPQDTSNTVIGQQVGQISRFLLDIKENDYVITPSSDTDSLHYGVIVDQQSYYYGAGNDGCPFRHRLKVMWNSDTIKRNEFSVPFQNTMRSSLTVFAVSHENEFFGIIGRNDLIKISQKGKYNAYSAVLEQILILDAKEFEILISHLLTALGFDDAKVTGRVGDGGVDATGILNVASLAKVKVFVQAKRYKLGNTISANEVKKLRQAIPSQGQGAFITTSNFQKKAQDIATEDGFPRIGLIDGEQLVDLLVEYWQEIPEEFQLLLNLKPGLVLK